jgi:hypothetical protein
LLERLRGFSPSACSSPPSDILLATHTLTAGRRAYPPAPPPPPARLPLPPPPPPSPPSLPPSLPPSPLTSNAR